MSSACAGLLRLIDNQCEQLALCFSRIYGVLKAECSHACKKTDLASVVGHLRSSDAAMSRHVIQIISLTSLVTLSDGRVKISIDGCLDRFVSYIFNYAAIHLLSSLSAVRGRVDAFRAMTSAMIFGADEFPGRKRLNSSVYSAGYEDSVHELTAEESAIDIAAAMLQPIESAPQLRPQDGDQCTADDSMSVSIGHQSGDLESVADVPGGSDRTAHSESANYEHCSAISSVKVPDALQQRLFDKSENDDYSVMDTRILVHERMAAFERDVVYIFPKQSAPGLVSSEVLIDIIRDTVAAAIPPSQWPDSSPAGCLSAKVCDRSSTPSPERIKEANNLLVVSPLTSPRDRLQQIKNADSKKQTARAVSVTQSDDCCVSKLESEKALRTNMSQPAVSLYPTGPSTCVSKRHVQYKAPSSRKKAMAARIERLTRPKKLKKTQIRPDIIATANTDLSMAEAAFKTEASNAAASRNHWFGRTLWRSSIIVKEGASPVRQKAALVRRSKSLGSSVVHFTDTDQTNSASQYPPTQSAFGPIDGLDTYEKYSETEEDAHQTTAALEAKSRDLMDMLKQSPKNKYYKSYDVKGTHKEFAEIVSELQRSFSESILLCKEALEWRIAINRRFHDMKHNPLIETFDESFFGADEKLKKETMHADMNAAHDASISIIKTVLETIAVFLEQYLIARRRYDSCPSNNALIYLEKFSIRKSRTLITVLNKACHLNHRIINHCKDCGPDGTRVTKRSASVENKQFNPISASLTIGSSWKSLVLSPFKNVSRSFFKRSCSHEGNGKPKIRQTYRDFAIQQRILPAPVEIPESPKPEPPFVVDIAQAISNL